MELDTNKQKRSFPAPGRFFLTWYINVECNYKCSYCKPLEFRTANVPQKRWIKIWEDIYERYGTCNIHISGGEPFIYPDFLDLIINLSKIHTFEFSTNLSWDTGPFLENVKPDRARIGASLHPEFADFDEFLRKILLLMSSQFEVWVNYVAYPPILKDMLWYKKRIQELGIPFSILPFDGNFEGRRYPKGYTEEEKKYLMVFEASEEVNKKTIDWKTEENKNKTKGLLCRMGQMYARIYPDAEVYRCCGNGAKRLGNLINGGLSLLEEPMPCDCEECPCWRCMLVGKEEDWVRHWVIPHKTKE